MSGTLARNSATTTSTAYKPMTHSTTAERKTRRIPAKDRKAIREAQALNERVTDNIMAEGAALASAAAKAAAVSQGGLSDAEIQFWIKDMNARLDVIVQHPEQNLGHIEEQIALSAKEPLRLVAERAT